MEFFATAAKGTEPALRDELRELFLRHVRADRGGVHFEGSLADGFKACFHSRIAVRVLTPLARFAAPDGDALYQGVREVDWTPHVSPRHTVAVSASCRSSGLTHTQFIAQRTKDAVVDQLRDRLGQRPSVDRDDPDVAIFVHLVKDEATVYLDLAGEPLHRRGYRTEAGAAPLKETLAAAIVRLSGWDRTSPLIDPMCGSGTLLIEGALLAAGVPPGGLRRRFGFERWASHDERARQAMRELREQAAARRPSLPPVVLGSDLDPAVVAIARANAARAGVNVTFERRPLIDLRPTAMPGFLVTNPPYGHRLEEGEQLAQELTAVARRLRGFQIAILAGSPALPRSLPFRPDRAVALFNGDLECRLMLYSMR
jgi:23S rRNA G2445 N2-methylase RlmL